DFHTTVEDFWPGEYQKTYTRQSGNDPQAIVDGLRSGDSFVVEGDLIDALDFTVNGAKMGSRLYATGTVVTVSVRVHDPEGANNCPTNLPAGINTPVLDHIDVIAGQFSGLIATNDPAYLSDSNVTTRVVGRFDAVGGATDSQGVTSTAWTDEGGGWKRMTLTYDTKGRKTYFRLRGSNIGLGVAGQTDAAGNPLLDPQDNTALKAWADLWFYSNPVFVQTPTVKVDANVYQAFDVGLTNGAWVYLEADPANASPLRATQRSLGYREVDYKATMFSFLRFTQVAPSNTGAGVMYDYTAQKTKGTYTVGYWKDKDLPVMIGPDGNGYITDGHHTSAGYLSPVNTQSGDVVPGLHRVVLGHVVTNFYNAAVGPVAVTDTWWTSRMAENNAMLYGVNGNQLALSGDAGYAGLQPILPSTLAMPITPSTLGAQAMTHDHYRGLAWGLADGIVKTATNGATKIKGYSKTNPDTGLDINFVEFFWSDYLRNRIVWDDTKSGHALGSGYSDANAISAPVSFFAAVANGIAMARSQDYRDQYGRGIVDYTNNALFSANTARWASKSIANLSYPAVAGDVYNLFLLDDSGIAGDIAPSPVAVNILHIDTSAGMVVSNRLVNIRNVAINAGGGITTVWKDAVVTNTTLSIPAGTGRVTLKGSNTVSGAVTLANGTLAVDGILTAASLTVASGATLEYMPGSAPITVTGNLALNGTLNITGSGFGVGAYTLFNCGSISGSGLVIGTVPDSSLRYSVSTNVPGTVQLLVENTPPSVSLVAPTNGATYLRGQTVSLAATASDDVSVAGVTFFVDGILVGTDTVEPYTANWTAATVGSHLLTAVAQDGAGLVTTSAVVMVTVVQPAVTHVGATYSEGNANGHEYGVDAFAGIQDAIDAVEVGGTVWVTNGVYNTGSTNLNGMETRVALTKAVTVRSINGAVVTVIEGSADKSATNGPSAIRCAYVGSGASLVGFTLTKGHTRELPTGSYTTAWDRQVFGGGVFAEAGGLVSDCLIKGNSSSLGGGGAAVESAATLRDCVVVFNNSPYGGGVAALTTGVVENCTLSDNTATTQAGGLYADHAVVRNTIIWSNTAPSSVEYYRSAGTFLRNCAKPLPVGTGNIALAPQFIGQAWGNYALAGTSPCIDAGTNQTWMTGAKDVDGKTRLQDGNGDGKTIVDIGACEFGTAPRLVITANGFNAPLTVAAGERVQVAITVNKGQGVSNKDWWMLQETPDANWQYYDAASSLWQKSIKVTYKGPFASMGVTPMLDSTTLPVGTNSFFFGVDSKMDGILQIDKLIYDSVQVIVTP
ncbi:MAG: Ig-like domain-containing protein, partial [bacterium]